MRENKTIQVLLIEENTGDAHQVKEALREETSITFELAWVDCLSEGLEYLDKHAVDVILLDLSLPDSNGLATFEKVKVKSPHAPIVILTVQEGQALAARVVQEGALDYLIKGQLDSRLLVKSIHYAIERGWIGDALQESEQKFSGLVDGSIDGIVLINENGEIIEWNAGEERIIGLKRTDSIGRMIWDILYQVQPDYLKTPDRYERLKGIFSSIHMGGRNPRPSQFYETELQRPDGTCRTIEMMFFVYKTNKGFRSGSITRDVTERKSAEAAIRESEMRYRSLFEDSPISMWEEDYSAVKQRLEELRQQGVTDFKTYLEDHPEVVAECVGKIKVLDVNNATVKLFRAESKADILDHVDKIINANSYHTIGDELVGIAEGITSFEKEVVDYTLTGEKLVIKLSWTAAPGNEASLSKVFLCRNDITERKMAEEEIKSLARFPAENPFPILRISLDGAILYANDASQPLLKDWGCVIGGYVPSDLMDLVTESLTSQSKVFADKTIGKQIYAIVVTPVLSAGYVNLYGMDITERKSAEDAIARQSKELHTRNTELDRLYRAFATLVPGASYNLKNMSESIVEFVSREFRSSVCSLFLVANNSQKLDRIAVVGPGADAFGKAEFTLDGPGLRPQVIRDGQITTVSDVRSIPGYVTIWEDARSMLIAPLKIGDRVIGVMDVESPELNAFDADDERLMSTFLERASLALEHAQLYAETERRMQHLSALHTIDMAITNSFNIELTLNILIERVLQELGIHAADILVYKPYLQMLKFVCGQGFRSHALLHTSLKLGEGYAGRVALERRLVHVPNLIEEPGGLAKSPELSVEGFVEYIGVPLIAKGEIKGVLEVFHRAPLVLDQEWTDFLVTLAGQAAIAIDNAELFDNLQHSNAELILAYDNTLAGWAGALELRDEETEGHTRRVTRMTLQLAQTMGISKINLVHINRGALLHDIGKMAVPDRIMLKPGPLTDEEWKIMRKHPQYAYDMIFPITFLRKAIDIPYCHHEKWDGTGYPRGLKGEQIPLSARIFAVVDVWDALSSDRPYRKAWSREQVMEHIKSQAGSHFDPKVVDAFLKLESHYDDAG